MIESLDDVLWWWDAADDMVPLVGGDPVFTRASSGYLIDEGAMLREVVADMPRVEWTNIGDERLPALRLEPADQSTPSLFSDQIDNAAWTKTSVTVAAGDEIAGPDGQIIAERLLETTGGGAHRVFEAGATITDGAKLAPMCCVRGVGREWIELMSASGGGNNARVFYHLSGAGAIGTIGEEGGATVHDTYIERLDRDWYLCLMLCGHGAGKTNTTPEVRIAIADGDTTYTGDVTKGIDLTAVQFADDVIGAASYIGPGGVSAVSRAIDQAYWTDAPDPQAMLIYLDVVLLNPLFGDNSARFLQIGKSDNTNARLLVWNNDANEIRVTHQPATATSATITLAGSSIGDRLQLVVHLDSDGSGRIVGSLNSGTPTGADFSAQALASSWSAAHVWLNSVGTTAPNAAKYRRLVIVKPDNVDAATDGTADQDLIDELAEVEVDEYRQLRQVF